MVVGSGLADSLGDSVGDGDSLAHGSGDGGGSTGGTDACRTGSSADGDGDEVGTAVTHDAGVRGGVGELAFDAGRPCGATIATPERRW